MSSIFQFSEDELRKHPDETLPSVFRDLENVEVPRETKKESGKQSIPKNIGRQIGRTASRVGETVLGAPRAFGDFAQSLVPEKALKSGAEKIGLGKGAENLIEGVKKFSPHKLFPTSEQVKSVSEDLFGEKVKPKNEWEQKSDELVSDFAALSLPVPGAKFKILKPFMTALGGNIASDIVGNLGGSEKQQALAKIGTFFAGSLINPKGADKLRKDLYSKAKSVLTEHETTSAKKLVDKTIQLKLDLQKGGTSESKTKALHKLDEIQKAIDRKDQIPVEELQKFKTSINESLAGLYDEFKSNKIGRKAARRNLEQVSGAVDDALKEYGKKNPEWEAFYRPANEVHGAIEQSKKVRNTIKKYSKSSTASGLAALFGLGNILGPAGAVGAAAVGTGALFAGEQIARYLKSPTIRKYYNDVVKAALRDDAIAIRQNMERLDKAIKEKE